MEVIGPAPEILSNAEIIRRYDSAISQVIAACADPQYDAERQILINQAKMNWLFVKGQHYGVPGMVDSQYGQIADYVPFSTGGNGDTGPDVKLCPPINFIGGDLYKYMAVLGRNAPKVKGVAEDAQDMECLAASEDADTNMRDLWAKLLIDRIWKVPAFHQYTTGPTFFRAVWNTDAQKHGQTMEPKIEVHTGPDGMPMPVVTGNVPYANGDAELEIHSILDISIPFMAKELSRAKCDCDWLRCEVMKSKWSLLARYPDQLEKFRDGDVPDDGMNNASYAAQDAKQTVTNPSSVANKPSAQWRFHENWADPSLFEAIKEKEARDVFKRQFPAGLYVAKAGSITLEIDNRDKVDEWSTCRVGRSEYIMERPVCADSVAIQRAIDDLVGMALETVLRAITQTLMDSQLIDRQAMNTKDAVPAEIILTALPVDDDIRKRFAELPTARLSDQVLVMLDKLRAIMQDIPGIRPELSGGGQPTQTFREAKQRKDQALLQLAPQADEMRFAAEGIATNLVRLRAKYGSGLVKSQRRGAYGVQTDKCDMADLKLDGWHAESDDQFPMTLSDRRDALYSMLKEFSPEVQQALSILDPLNIDELFELLQVAGFESAVLDQKKKTLSDINKLLREQAMDGPPGPDGNPGPKTPSIAPDAYDDHALVANMCAKWLVSQQKIKDQNPAGFENVEAYYVAQLQMSTPPSPPPVPAVKAALSLSMKLEDAPYLIPEVLQAAGLPAPPPDPVPVPAPSPDSGDMGSPAPIGGPGPHVPLPPLPDVGMPHAPMGLQ